MSYRSIALIGKARAGKDTVGKRLVERWAFTRLAFADPLKRMALELNPWVTYDRSPDLGVEAVRLSDLVRHVGWERAKDNYPEVRRILQHAGQTVRDLDPDFWVRTLMDKVKAAHDWNMPVVVTDCRYLNEAEALRAAGFMLVRVRRPGELTGRAGQHVSETELDSLDVPTTIINSGSLFDLDTQADSLIRPLAL